MTVGTLGCLRTSRVPEGVIHTGYPVSQDCCDDCGDLLIVDGVILNALWMGTPEIRTLPVTMLMCEGSKWEAPESSELAQRFLRHRADVVNGPGMGFDPKKLWTYRKYLPVVRNRWPELGIE